MWYELFLRREAPLPWSALVEALPAAATVRETERGLQVSLGPGAIELAVHPPGSPGDRITGADLLVPGGANPELAQAGCDVAFGLAESCDLAVYDPQLGRTVTARDADHIQARMARYASYLTETVGLDEAAAARHIGVDQPRQRMSLRTRFYLVLAGGLALLLLLARYC